LFEQLDDVVAAAWCWEKGAADGGWVTRKRAAVLLHDKLVCAEPDVEAVWIPGKVDVVIVDPAGRAIRAHRQIDLLPALTPFPDEENE